MCQIVTLETKKKKKNCLEYYGFLSSTILYYIKIDEFFLLF